MKTSILKRKKIRNGFTMIEVMMSVGLFLLIIAGTLSVYLMCQEVYHSTSQKMRTTQYAGLALARMVYGIGTNSGLRSASSIDVNTNVWGDSFGTNNPPAPGAGTHRVYTDAGPPDSWRITFSNQFDGLHYIDYNRAASNIVYWPVITGFPYEPTRQLISDYVISSTVSTTNGGIFISITLALHHGRFHATNTVSTFVKMRNK